MRSRGVFWVLHLYRFLPPLGTIIFPELSGNLTLIMGCLHFTLIFAIVFTAVWVEFVSQSLEPACLLGTYSLRSDHQVLVPLVFSDPGLETPHQCQASVTLS